MLVPFTTLPQEMKQCTLLNQGSFSWENDNRSVAVGTYSNPGWLNKKRFETKNGWILSEDQNTTLLSTLI